MPYMCEVMTESSAEYFFDFDFNRTHPLYRIAAKGALVMETWITLIRKGFALVSFLYDFLPLQTDQEHGPYSTWIIP